MACRKMNEDVAYARNTESGCKTVSMRKPDRTRQEVIQLKSLISLKLGTNVAFGE